MATGLPALALRFWRRQPCHNMKNTIVQLVSYGIAGLAINGFGYFLFLIFLALGIGHKTAASILYIVGVLISYSLNRKFVFKSTSSLGVGLLWHLAMVAVGYVINISILYYLVDQFKFDPKFVQLLSIVVVSTFFFTFNKFVVHKRAKVPHENF